MKRRRNLHHPGMKGVPVSDKARLRDDELLLLITQRDEQALGLLYDRYGPAIYSLARQKHPTCAEFIVERVFADLWNMGRHGRLPVPIMPLLLDLAARALAEPPVPPVLSTSEPAVQDALALLAQVGHADPLVCNALVLVCLGKLNIAESAVALAVEPAVVRHALTSGLALLRQLQPVADAEFSHVRRLPAG